jgi:hypothetical protein
MDTGESDDKHQLECFIKARIQTMKFPSKTQANLVMNVIYGYIPSNTTITVFQLVFTLSYMFRPVYNGHLQALAQGGVLHTV